MPGRPRTKILDCAYCRGILQKDIDECMTHNIRDEDGNITCPEIEKIVCSYCNADHVDELCPHVMFYQPSLEDRVKIAIAADEHKRNKKHNGKRH